MLILPRKYSKKWLFPMVVLFLMNFSALIANSLILKISINAENSMRFALVSLTVAISISAGGYLGARAYFYTALFLNLIGIFYMMYVSTNRTAEGWSDLVTMISYLFIVGIGILLGLAIQGICFLKSKINH